jgi:spore maturation protein CgeB
MKKGILQNKKILIVAPAFLEWDLGSYVRSILQDKKFDCSTFAYQPFETKTDASRHLMKIAKDYKPDIILGLKLDKIEASVVKSLKKKGIFVAFWFVDCFSDKVPNWIKPLVKEVNVFFTTAKGSLPKYRAIANVPVYWIYEGAHLPAFPQGLKMNYPKKIYKSEVAFVGTVFNSNRDKNCSSKNNKNIYRARQRLLKRINKAFHLKIWGPQIRESREKWGSNYPAIEWPAYNEELVKICRESDIILGINSVNSVELYFSNRTYITLASGGFHLTQYVPGLEKMFENCRHLVWFHSDAECLDLINYYLKRPDQRKKIAREGQRWVRKKYSMKRQINKILAIIANHYGKA